MSLIIINFSLVCMPLLSLTLIFISNIFHFPSNALMSPAELMQYMQLRTEIFTNAWTYKDINTKKDYL